MSAGYSGKLLYQKLGIQSDHYVAVVNPPDNYFELLEGEIEQKNELPGLHKGRFDIIHVFVSEKDKLKSSIMEAMFSVTPWGMIWISWPKKAPGVKVDFTEDNIRKIALDLGLVDVKVCAVDDYWSGLKLVFRNK